MRQFQQLVEMPFTNVTRLIPPDQWSNNGMFFSFAHPPSSLSASLLYVYFLSLICTCMTACDAETAMDLELMLTIGSGANTFFFTNQHWYAFLSFLSLFFLFSPSYLPLTLSLCRIYEFTQTLMTLPNPPLVTSLSWGWMEAQQCDQLLNSVCNQLGIDSEVYVKR